MSKEDCDPNTPNDVDIEILGSFEKPRQLRQGLHQRHIQMIALAGTVGTGLFLGSGRALAQAGPLGALLAYTIMGAAVSGVVLAVGEMGALIPLNGGVVRYAEYFVDPALAFANGWNQVYGSLVAIPAEIVATAVLIDFWVSVNNAVWITIFGALILITSLLFVRVYGELEFVFATVKIALIVLVNIMAVVISTGAAPNHTSIGFRYWQEPGSFVQYLGINGALGRFLGFWTTLNNAVFAYAGVEGITVAAAETRNPRRAIPVAARRIFWRILLFYTLTIFTTGLVVPSNDLSLLTSFNTATQSPFVVAARRAEIGVVPSIINAVIVTSAWSSGNSGMLGGSRVLYGLALDKHAPKIFTRLNQFGVPYVAICFFGLFMCLGFMTLSSTASTVFTWLQDLVAAAVLTNWIVVCGTYLRFFYACQKQGVDRKQELPWAAPLQPYLTWSSLVLFSILLLTGGYTTFIRGHWSTQTFVSSYLNVPLVLGLYFAYKLVRKTKLVPLEEVPIRRFLEVANQTPEPKERPRKGLRKLNVLWS